MKAVSYTHLEKKRRFISMQRSGDPPLINKYTVYNEYNVRPVSYTHLDAELVALVNRKAHK